MATYSLSALKTFTSVHQADPPPHHLKKKPSYSGGFFCLLGSRFCGLQATSQGAWPVGHYNI